MCTQGVGSGSRDDGLYRKECAAEFPAKRTPDRKRRQGDRVTAQILMTGSTALSTAARLMTECRGEMERQFPSFFRAVFNTDDPDEEGVRIPLPAALERHRAHLPEALRIAEEHGCLFCREVGREGVLRSLWKMGEELELGMEVHIKKIPIRQETIEICEHLDLNPYQLYGQGAILAAVPEKGGETSPESGF